MELKEVANYIAEKIIYEINFYQQSVKGDLPYNKQEVLKELIKILQEKV